MPPEPDSGLTPRQLGEVVYRLLYPGDRVPVGFLPSTSWGDAGRVLDAMHDLGSSVTVNWGEDTNQWECDWIREGRRWIGIGHTAQLAICRAAIGGLS